MLYTRALMNLAPGVSFQDYRILARIGVGGMAEVWRAERAPAGELVAIKFILETISEDPRFGERFFREARILTRLRHPHVIEIVAFGEVEGEPFLVTPFLSGGSLADRIRTGRVGESAIPWLKAIASALDFAHGQGVIHRDVKPTNVLFDSAGVPYLSDFGLAKACSSRELTTTGAAMGTPLYMSPEQVRGDELDARTDVYSLGVVAYQLVCGKRPYAGDSVATVLHKTLHVMPAAPSTVEPGLPASVDRVVLRAIAKERTARYDTCAAFVADLERALRGTGPEWASGGDGTEGTRTATEVTLPQATPRPEDERPAPDPTVPRFAAVTVPRPRRWGLAGIAAALLLGLGLLLAFRERLVPARKAAAGGLGAADVAASGPAPLAGLMTARKDLEGLAAALQAYAIDHGGYPDGPWTAARRELERGYGTPATLAARDPWGQGWRYFVSRDRRAYVLVSPGADGVYQNGDAALALLLESRGRATSQVRGGDDATTDIVVCNGTFVTVQDHPSGLGR